MHIMMEIMIRLFVFTFAGDSCEDGERSNCKPSPVGHTIDRLWLKRIKAMNLNFDNKENSDHSIASQKRSMYTDLR